MVAVSLKKKFRAREDRWAGPDYGTGLYVIRRRAEKAIRYAGLKGTSEFYILSLSYKTLVYKGMLMAEQLEEFYPDLADPSMDSALAVVHSRFSTNTFPSWDRAHPYRYIAHNGEINTVRGNSNWMHAREARFEAELFGEESGVAGFHESGVDHGQVRPPLGNQPVRGQQRLGRHSADRPDHAVHAAPQHLGLSNRERAGRPRGRDPVPVPARVAERGASDPRAQAYSPLPAMKWTRSARRQE